MDKPETGEKKLLKIIENQGASAPAPASPAGQEVAQKVSDAVKGAGLPSISAPGFLAPVLGILTGKFFVSPGAGFGIREINKLLAAGVLAAFFVFALNTAAGLKSLRRKISFELDTAVSAHTKDLMNTAQDLKNYLTNIQRRNIFQPYEKKEGVDQLTVAVGMQHITAATKDLKLVGISWFEDPDSVSAMVEDTVSGVTHFLKTGDKINEVTVKNIYADKVVLTLDGEEMTLRL